MERHLHLITFNNRNALTKTRFLSHNLAINTTKWYNLQEYQKIYEDCERKEKENEIHIICNIRRRALNDINEVGNINFQTGNKIKKTKTFFAEVSLLKFLSLDKSWRQSLN